MEMVSLFISIPHPRLPIVLQLGIEPMKLPVHQKEQPQFGRYHPICQALGDTWSGHARNFRYQFK